MHKRFAWTWQWFNLLPPPRSRCIVTTYANYVNAEVRSSAPASCLHMAGAKGRECVIKVVLCGRWKKKKVLSPKARRKKREAWTLWREKISWIRAIRRKSVLRKIQNENSKQSRKSHGSVLTLEKSLKTAFNGKSKTSSSINRFTNVDGKSSFLRMPLHRLHCYQIRSERKISFFYCRNICYKRWQGWGEKKIDSPIVVVRAEEFCCAIYASIVAIPPTPFAPNPRRCVGVVFAIH